MQFYQNSMKLKKYASTADIFLKSVMQKCPLYRQNTVPNIIFETKEKFARGDESFAKKFWSS